MQAIPIKYVDFFDNFVDAANWEYFIFWHRSRFENKDKEEAWKKHLRWRRRDDRERQQ